MASHLKQVLPVFQSHTKTKYIEWSDEFNSAVIITNIFKKETNELNNEILKKVEVELTPEEIELVWWKIIAFFKWKELIKYEIWDKYIMDVINFDINNDFWNLLSKKVSKLYFSRWKDWKLQVDMWDWRIYKQNENMFHRAFYLQFGRIKEPIKK